MVKKLKINEDYNDMDIKSVYNDYVEALDNLRDYIDNLHRHLKRYNKDIKVGFEYVDNESALRILKGLLTTSIDNINKIYDTSITDPIAILSFVNKSR